VEEFDDGEMTIAGGPVHDVCRTAWEGMRVEPTEEREVAMAGGPEPGIGREFMGVEDLGGDDRGEEEVAEVPLDEVHGEEAAGGDVINKDVEGDGTGGRIVGHAPFLEDGGSGKGSYEEGEKSKMEKRTKGVRAVVLFTSFAFTKFAKTTE